MKTIALLALGIPTVIAVSFHFGSKHGRALALNDFRGQMKSHREFYEHNLQAGCPGKLAKPSGSARVSSRQNKKPRP